MANRAYDGGLFCNHSGPVLIVFYVRSLQTGSLLALQIMILLMHDIWLSALFATAPGTSIRESTEMNETCLPMCMCMYQPLNP